MRIPFDVVLDSTAAAMLPCWNIAKFCGNDYRNLLKLSHICEHCRREVFFLRVTWFSEKRYKIPLMIFVKTGMCAD